MVQKGIFFDLDGTLVYTTSSREERFLNLSRKAGLSFSFQEIREAYRYADKWWKKQGFKFSDWTRKNFLHLNYILLKNLGIGAQTGNLAQEISTFWEKIPWSKPYPETKKVLKDLKNRGYRLGVFSHRSPAGIQRVINHLEWQKYFHSLISPVDAEAPQGKKDSRMWEYGLEKIGLGASRIIHVGDEYETDVVRAEKNGILPILIDRNNRYSYGLHCYVGPNLNILLRFLG